MDGIPRDMLQARLRFDEELDVVLRAGDHATVLRVIDEMRSDLRIFARQARRLAAPAGDPGRPADDLATARHREEDALAEQLAAGGENVVLLFQHRARGHVNTGHQ